MPLVTRFTFAQRKFYIQAPAVGRKFGIVAPLSRPFFDNGGVREYPPMYTAITNIYERYRVINVSVVATFYSSGSATPAFGAIFPLNSNDTSSIDQLEEVYNLPKSVTCPLGNEFSKPVVRR
jgi:hypothetical protein